MRILKFVKYLVHSHMQTQHRIILYLAVMVGEGRGPQCKVFKLVPLFTVKL